MDESTIERVLIFASGIVMFKVGSGVATNLQPGDPIGTVVMMAAYGLGVALAVMSMTNHQWIDQHGRYIAYGTFFVLVLGKAIVVLDDVAFGTDALLFTRYAVDLTLSGQSPYGEVMQGSLSAYPNAEMPTISPRVDGDRVFYHAYPGGSVLAFLPQRLLGVGNVTLALTPFLFAVGVFATLIAISPEKLMFLPVVMMEFPRDYLAASAGGVLDAPWVLFIVLCIVALYTDRIFIAGVLLGVAVSMKQQPWLIAPFATAFVAHRYRRVWAGTDFAETAIITFGIINLPFIILGPRKWVETLFIHVTGGSGAPIVSKGVGLTALSSNGVYTLPQWFFTLALAGAGIVAIIVYIRNIELLGWTAFAAPQAILYFSHRSLASYFLLVTPVLYAAMLASDGSINVGVPDVA